MSDEATEYRGGDMMRSLVGERLSERPAPEVLEHVYGVRLAEEAASTFPYMTAVNQAHVVMLRRRGIISPAAARALLGAINALARRGPRGIRWDPRREDVFFNYEAALIARIGPAAGGQLHTARSRNDLGATLVRLRLRDAILDFLPRLFQARRAAIDQARRFAGVVMPGYTHLQPAQPITFGHYLLGIAAALERDSRRIAQTYEITNRSPLGAGALAGTTFPIDRALTARLLGFDDLVEHTVDAVASRDFALELMAACALFGVTCSRVAQDLFVWYSREFGMIDLPDRVAGTSSIMPQKKNPVVLEHLKGRPAHLLGAFVTAATAIKNTHFTNTLDGNRESLRGLWTALDDAGACASLLTLALASAAPNAQLMLERARGDFSTATDLADLLVRRSGLSFRQAHGVVGAVVREALARGLRADEITADLTDRAARHVTGRPARLDPEAVRAALDPRRSVSDRRTPGGPAPREVRRLATVLARRLAAEEREQAERRRRAAQARARLAAAMRNATTSGADPAHRATGRR